MKKALLRSTTSLNRLGVAFCALTLMLSAAVYALQGHSISNKGNMLSFSGKHAGMAFTGVFEKWEASLILPPIDNPSITATFDLASAKTGDFTYDSTLPEGDWFDAENHPEGTFVSESIEPSENGYKVSGQLTLRGVSKSQTFELKQSGNVLNAVFAINRLEYGIGIESDPEAEWVSRDILMTLKLTLE